MLRYPFLAVVVAAVVAIGGCGRGGSSPVDEHVHLAGGQADDDHVADDDDDDHAADAHDHATEASIVVGVHEHDDHGEHEEAADNHGDTDEADHDDEAEAEHVHVLNEANEEFTLSLSPQARRNLRLSVVEVQRQPFEKTVTIPAMVVERPGLARIEISAPLTGVVTSVYHTKGETVTAGEPLFQLRLTHEELVQAQREFLGTLEQIDVVRREVERLREVTESGAVAGKTYLERKYELQKLEAALKTLREALLLHGLSEDQVDQIVVTRELFKVMTVAVPVAAGAGSDADQSALLQLRDLSAYVGQHVDAGQRLCVLSNYRELYLEGRAFEKDARQLERTADAGWKICAVCDTAGSDGDRVDDLRLLFFSGEVDSESRALRFYTELPNQITRDTTSHDGRRFVTWRFRPGQRCQLLVPVERWEDRIVLPIDAVVDDGAESYAFVEHDGHFDRRPVEVVYRDQFSVVLGPASEVQPGDHVAASGAHQMNLAIKNQSGGGMDPHAGHQH